MKYICSVVKPKSDGAKHFVEAASPEDAANDFWYANECSYGAYTFLKEDGERIRFAKVEVDGHGQFICRVFISGIHRLGRKAVRSTIEDIANKLSWKHPVHELLEKWQGE